MHTFQANDREEWVRWDVGWWCGGMGWGRYAVVARVRGGQDNHEDTV